MSDPPSRAARNGDQPGPIALHRRRRVAIVVHAVVAGDARIRRQSDALLDAGYDVDIFALRGSGEEPMETDGRLRIIRLPVNRTFVGFAGHMAEYLAFAAIASVRLTAEHRHRGYDLVQVASVPDFLAFAALPLKLAGVPVLLDLHEDMPEFYRDRFRRPPLPALMPLVTGATKASAAVADRLITVHEPLRQLSIDRGVAPERISVVMNAADERIFDPSRFPRRAFMADGELRIIHHSNLQRIYGLDLAVEAVAMLGDEVPLRLDVYGDGPYRPAIDEAIARTGTGDRVHLHGRVAIEELPRLIADADVGIVPSVDEPYLKYSLSTKLLEYVAMGIPVIASDLATFRVHFTDGALLYVRGGDPAALAQGIRQVISDPDAAAERAREAMAQARRYRWTDQRTAYLAVVEQTLRR